MRYKVRMKLDMTISDDKHSKIRKHQRKNPIGPPIEIEGSLSEIKKKILAKLDNIDEMLKKWEAGMEEDINV